MFTFYEHDSIFHRMNPTAKMVAIGVAMIVLTFSFDPFVPASVLFIVLTLAKWFAKIPLKTMLQGLFPFIMLGFGFLWMHVGFSRGNHVNPWFQIGNFIVYQEALMRGSALMFRVNAYAAFSLLFVATTNPTDFLLSLMQQARVSPKIGYSILAAYRFFPLYQSEFQILKEAHLVRGMGIEKSLGHRFKQIKRFSIPLIAQAIRKAERVAIAIEARGFTNDKDRVFYRQLKVSHHDWILALGIIMLVPMMILIVYVLGGLTLWRGGLFF